MGAKSAVTARKRPSSGTHRTKRDQRADIAARLRDLAEELREIGERRADDLRLAGDLLSAIAFPVEHFEDEALGADRGVYVEAMVASLNLLARRWKPEQRWWLDVAERERLAAAEAERLELARRGVYR
jgi:hypothetical protein